MSIPTTSIVITDEWFEAVLADAKKRALKGLRRSEAIDRGKPGQFKSDHGKPGLSVGPEEFHEHHQALD